jgi:hypothetical protein
VEIDLEETDSRLRLVTFDEEIRTVRADGFVEEYFFRL